MIDNRARIRRGPAPARRRNPGGPRRQQPGKVQRRPSAASQALATLPLPIETMKRAGNWVLIGLLGGGLLAGVVAMGVPGMIGTAIGQGIGALGFTVRAIQIEGIDRMDRGRVYQVVAEERARAMPLVDLEDVRRRLMRFGWIKEARVSRRLPDTLVVDIVERRPAAVWQDRGRLALIDAEGIVIAPVRLDELPPLPIVIGPGANRQATALARLLDGAPSIRPVFAGATWIGDRRWDIRFRSGETLALPEGDAAAADALAYFVRQDRKVRLLGRGFVRFDLRDPRQMVVRVSGEPGHSVDDAAKRRKAEAEAAAKARAAGPVSPESI